MLTPEHWSGEAGTPELNKENLKDYCDTLSKEFKGSLKKETNEYDKVHTEGKLDELKSLIFFFDLNNQRNY